MRSRTSRSATARGGRAGRELPRELARSRFPAHGAGRTKRCRYPGYMPATEGKAIVAGFDVSDQPIERRRTGYMPETPVYPDMTEVEYLVRLQTQGRPSAERATVHRSWNAPELPTCETALLPAVERLPATRSLRRRSSQPEGLDPDEPTAGWIQNKSSRRASDHGARRDTPYPDTPSPRGLADLPAVVIIKRDSSLPSIRPTTSRHGCAVPRRVQQLDEAATSPSDIGHGRLTRVVAGRAAQRVGYEIDSAADTTSGAISRASWCQRWGSSSGGP